MSMVTRASAKSEHRTMMMPLKCSHDAIVDMVVERLVILLLCHRGSESVQVGLCDVIFLQCHDTVGELPVLL